MSLVQRSLSVYVCMYVCMYVCIETRIRVLFCMTLLHVICALRNHALVQRSLSVYVCIYNACMRGSVSVRNVVGLAQICEHMVSPFGFHRIHTCILSVSLEESFRIHVYMYVCVCVCVYTNAYITTCTHTHRSICATIDLVCSYAHVFG
jgi:hypothetical protein